MTTCQVCETAESVHVAWLTVEGPCPKLEALTGVAAMRHMHICPRHFHVHFCHACLDTGAFDDVVGTPNTTFTASDVDRWRHDHEPATGATWN